MAVTALRHIALLIVLVATACGGGSVGIGGANDAGNATRDDRGCIDVGEPLAPICEGNWCVEGPLVPVPSPVLLGGTGEHDVWVLDEDGALAHYGCDGFRRLPGEPLGQTRDACGAHGCSFAAIALEDQWIATAAGVFHFDGTSWSPAEVPADAAAPRVWLENGELWLTSATEPVAYRYENRAWAVHSRGLGAPLRVLAGDGVRELWGAGETWLRFDGESFVELGISTGDAALDASATSLVVLAPDDVWAAFGPVDGARHWNGERWEDFASGPQVPQGDVFRLEGDEVWFEGDSFVHRFDGSGFQLVDAIEDRFVFDAAVIGGRLWIADSIGTIGRFDGHRLRSIAGAFATAPSSFTYLASGDGWAIGGVEARVLRDTGSGWFGVYELKPDRAFDPVLSFLEPAVGMWASASDNVWFSSVRDHVGTNYVRWDGASFSELTLEGIAASGVYSSQPGQLWAYSTRAVYERTGEGWTEHHPVSLPADRRLHVMAFAGAGPTDVWASGEKVNTDLVSQPWLAHWDGARWREHVMPGTHGAHALAVHGEHDLMLMTAIDVLHWNGSAFATVTPSYEGDPPNGLLRLPDGGYLLTNASVSWIWQGGAFVEHPPLAGRRPDVALDLEHIWSSNGLPGRIWRFIPP